ncbi:MAG: hypothetical protein KUG82_09920 [Pseudomonadales bacterium]|mgnify:CR=1 FL=1|nr:hypothetical protein [Pseudomonadales bacterium]
MNKKVIGSLALLVSGSAVADGSTWIGTPGNTTLSISHVNQTANTLFVADQKANLPDDLEQSTQWLNVSHVLSDNLNTELKLGYADSDFNNDGDSGVTGATLGATWRLRDEFLSQSWLPSVALRGAINIAGNYQEGEVNSIGDGANDVEISVIAGKAVNTMLAVSGEIGYRLRDSGVDDDLFVNLNGYLQLTDKLGASLGYHLVNAQGDIDIMGEGFNGDFTVVAEDTSLADINVTYQFNHQFSVTGTRAEIIDGKNTSKSRISAITLSYLF